MWDYLGSYMKAWAVLKREGRCCVDDITYMVKSLPIVDNSAKIVEMLLKTSKFNFFNNY